MPIKGHNSILKDSKTFTVIQCLFNAVTRVYNFTLFNHQYESYFQLSGQLRLNRS